ncbi:peptidase M28 [Altererythrobacter sp. B11]|uniref:M20/M25/M40 family metallo-hydrolase n=1 Tax=Altererythrobacter sp. B11 TaxID=2060312 RepID=UPI000DC7247B|nr:M20/M25/M40 family metallo-hydrolase [Altererythrobacter sp. B11]BBC72371.1 peptidase M28 [Altererythrobacter sp. B11]
MHPKHLLALSGAAFLALSAYPALAGDPAEMAEVMDEGLNRSAIPATASELLDGIGARLTNSPAMRRAEEWALEEFRSLGLSNVHREGFYFGRGWEASFTSATMVAPRPLQLTAAPIAWTPGTGGQVVQAPVVVAPMSKPEHFDAYRGKLAGKIVLVDLPGTGDEPDKAPFRRLDAGEIAKRDEIALPDYDPDADNRRLKRLEWAMQLDSFLKSEGALAMVKISYRDGKLLHGSGYTFAEGSSPVVPGFEMAAEDYRRLTRLAKTGPAPVLALSSDAHFVDTDPMAYNIIAEIPGTDPKAGYVMAGAHFDSWAMGDGAVDNGAGSLAVMEAARILKTIGAKPRRTIRFALWSGEEQGLLGSLAYVRQHLVTRKGDDGSASLETYYKWGDLWPVEAKPGYYDLKAYFNMDNGSGKLRGIHAEGNVAAEPLLKKWLSPFAGLGADAVVSGSTSGTDHVFLQAIGLPGFQFVQDPLDYSARLHHTNIDTLDHMKMDDMRQAAVVIAGLLLQSANDSETLPREPLPKQPAVTDPFKYEYPDKD